MSENADTHEKFRKLLHSRRLPSRCPNHLLAGRGSTQGRCVVCDDLLAPDQIVIEADSSGAGGPSRLCFHGRCFWAIQSVWGRVEPAAESTDNRAGSGLAAASGRSPSLKRSFR